MGRLLGIAIRNAPWALMETMDSALVTPVSGVEGDCRGQLGSRQVTVLAKEAWAAACKNLQVELPWTTRRANLFITGIALEGTTRQILRIGRVDLEITGETDPCRVMDLQYAGLRRALTPSWRGGVTCRVLTEGRIQIGDEVQLLLTRGTNES